MGIRQTLNQNPVGSAIGAGVVIVLALGFVIVRGCMSGKEPAVNRPITKAFFSTDDGKTFFVDEAKNIPPYKVNKPGDPNNGKVAWRARVVKCGGDKMVAVLEKYGDYEKQQLEYVLSQSKDAPGAVPREGVTGVYPMLKKPGSGDSGWLPFSVATAAQWVAMSQPICPDGTQAVILSAD